jgi:hypothetical protein
MAMLREFIVWVGLVGAVLFPILFSWFNRETWWRTQAGWHLLSFSFVAMIYFISSALSLELGPNYPFSAQVRAGLGILAVVVVWWRLILYIRTRFINRDSA